MREVGMRFRLFLLSLIVFSVGLLLPEVTAAEGLKTLWISVTACEDSAEMPSCAVAWYKRRNGEYFMLMPGGTDWGEARVWFSGPRTILIGEDSYASGDRISGLTENTDLTIQAGKEKFRLSIRQGSEIGAVFVETASGKMKKIDESTKYKEEGGNLTFLNPDGSIACQGPMAHFKLRGNTSTKLSKKNYGFKLEKGADLSGLGKAKRWALIGNCRDLSLLRNQICLDLARYANLLYTPDAAPVDLYLNHRYHGCYLLSERIEVHSERVDIYDLEKANEKANTEPLSSYRRVGETKTYKNGKYKAFALPSNPEDITGGYILEYENYQPRYGTELCAFVTTRSKVFLFKEPEIVSAEEAEYAIRFMQGYEDAIFSEDGKNPSTGKYYWEYVDFDSLVRKYMLEEISMNTDGNGSSQFYFKPADSVSTVFYAGPAWDYDATLASFSARDFQDRFLDPTKLLLTTVDKNRYYWPRLYARDEFRQAVCETWESVYAPAVRVLLGLEQDPSGRLRSLEEYADQISKSASMNFIRWPVTGQKNPERTGRTWEDNLAYLRRILEQRYETLETLWKPE